MTFSVGGAYWTRTSDPIDVNDVLYQLSQSTVVYATLSATHIIVAQVVGDVKGESGENRQKFS